MTPSTSPASASLPPLPPPPLPELHLSSQAGARPPRPLIEPTRAYDGLPGLSAAEAADWMITAARTRPVRIAPRMAVTAHALNSVAPNAVDALMKRQRVQPKD